MPAPVGAETTIVPVATKQDGCEAADAVGTEGVGGCALTVTLVAADVQPCVFFAVTLYVPAATPVKIPSVFV
jgi:hypothetical protein